MTKEERLEQIAHIIMSGQCVEAVRTGRNYVTVEAANKIANEIYHQLFERKPGKILQYTGDELHSHEG